MRKESIIYLPLALVAATAIVGCSGTKYLADGEQLLVGNRVVSDNPSVSVAHLSTYVKQKPNTKWFSLFKVPLGLYSLSGRDTTKAINRRLRKWGEAPVAVDSILTRQTTANLAAAMQNEGYLDAEAWAEVTGKKRRATVTYHIVPGERYHINKVEYNILDRRIDSLLRQSGVLGQALRAGDDFSLTAMLTERQNITDWLLNHGYYYFNKEAISFNADSARADRSVDVLLQMGLYRRSSHEELREHPQYTLRNVTFEPIAGQEMRIRQHTLDINNQMLSGELYSTEKMQGTYRKFSRLQAIQSTNIRITEPEDTTGVLDARIQLARRKTHSVQVQPEGTNTAGDLGAALSLTYENRNVFHGSEKFTLQVRGAFEAIRDLEGYEAKNYQEYNIEGKLLFPTLICPWVSDSYQRRHAATSEIAVSYNWQNRPEFHRRVLTGTWRYKWNSISGKTQYRYDFIDLNYISMPWISDTFQKDYLESENSRNAILRYNYEDLLIMKMGLGVTYTNGDDNLRLNVETAGNFFCALANIFKFAKNGDGQYKVARVAYAQYAKLDADYTHLFHLDTRNTLALHARVGIAVPYGNSKMLPFEKRFFAGGANSVRGWSVRTLGPGRFISKDGRIDFINKTGDMKIDLNAELRTNLFWKFQGAVFVDAGNIWTLREYDDQPGGQFTFKGLWQDMAVAYGIGLRLNFDIFLLRLDLGMKAIDPAYTDSKGHYPIANFNFKRDYALHFAVGLPF